MQLAKMAETLKAKGIAVAAVQATPMDQNELSQWVKKNKIPFPVGMIQSDEEKTRFAWGVRSLPWLILTDQNHVVVSHGFGYQDLNSQLNQNDP
jgi:glutaredoxin